MPVHKPPGQLPLPWKRSVAVDEMSLVLSLFSAARVSGDVVRQLDKAPRANQMASLLVTFADYSVATALGSPIPTGLYLAEHDKIETTWRSRRATT